MADNFELHPRLHEDCFEICDLPQSKLLLMNDARFLWCIIVPRVDNIVEWHDLPNATQTFDEAMQISKILKAFPDIDKINIGAIGNMVPQLHIHIIGRKITDNAWPAPVWGSGDAIAYDTEDAKNLIAEIRANITL